MRRAAQAAATLAGAALAVALSVAAAGSLLMRPWPEREAVTGRVQVIVTLPNPNAVGSPTR